MNYGTAEAVPFQEDRVLTQALLAPGVRFFLSNSALSAA
jgi:hypothetical protein